MTALYYVVEKIIANYALERFLLRWAQRTALDSCFYRVFYPKTGSHFSENALKQFWAKSGYRFELKKLRFKTRN